MITPHATHISTKWHLKLWATGIDESEIESLIKSPRVGQRIEQLCYEEMGVSDPQNSGKEWDLLLNVCDDRALTCLGAARYAPNWARSAFLGKTPQFPDGLDPTVVNTAMRLNQDIQEAITIQVTDADITTEDLIKAGAEIVASWIESLDDSLATPLFLSLDTSGPVMRASNTLDTLAVEGVLQNYASEIRHEN